MERMKLILDFDKKYSDPNDIRLNELVLSSDYDNGRSIPVKKFSNNLELNVNEFNKNWEDLYEKVPKSISAILKGNSATFFRGCLDPLAKWCEAIDFCFLNYKIEEVEFTSYCNNQKLFVYEAEGEINKEFFYKKSFFLPYYLNIYINSKFKIESYKQAEFKEFKVKFLHKLRNFLLFFFITIKFLVYKFFVLRRKYAPKGNYKEIFSSRAIVQTEFISNYHQFNANTILLVNEQSFRPFKHHNFLKKKEKSFIYCEGNLSLRRFLFLIKNYFINLFFSNSNKFILEFQGIKINLNSFLVDLLTKSLDYQIYAESVKRTIEDYNLATENSKVISFEMFTPYPFFLKDVLTYPILQVQTTLIEAKRNPKFIAGNKFYFTNPYSYKDFLEKNLDYQSKLACIPFLKYVGTKQKISSKDLNQITYFTQPIDLKEEEQIIKFLDDFSLTSKISLIIKPHPRQINKYFLNSPYSRYALGSEDSEKLIMNSDLIITRTSSLGLDAWVYGTPVLFLKLNETSRNLKLPFAPNDYKGCINRLEDLLFFLKNYKQLQEEFFSNNFFLKIKNIKEQDSRLVFHNE